MELKEIQVRKEQELKQTIREQEERLRQEYEEKMANKAQDRIQVMKKE